MVAEAGAGAAWTSAAARERVDKVKRLIDFIVLRCVMGMDDEVVDKGIRSRVVLERG